jgi:hypothetical protein
LIELSLGLAGTAKNTGKTTTTATIIGELRTQGISFYLTSIGYDGENLDNITGLPKPKLRVEQGDIIATAERCLQTSTAALKKMIETDISTPLGKVSVVKVEKPGLVVTAGPNKSLEVKRLQTLLHQFGPGITIFDGALNRIAPMAETDGFILATGAAKTPDIPRLAWETNLISRITNLPIIPGALALRERQLTTVTLLSNTLLVQKQWAKTSLLAEADVDTIVAQSFENDSYLYIPGIISEKALERLMIIFKHHEKRLLLAFADPIKLLVTGNPKIFELLTEHLPKLGIFVGVLKPIPMLAVTVNPFYSEYRYESKTYLPAYVDGMRLQLAIQRNSHVPVFNVVKQGAGKLVELLLTRTRRWEGPGMVRF